jgi:hypothetical protein
MVNNLDLSVIVLCPERNIGGLKGTVGSIKHHFYNRDVICVTGSNASAEEIKEMKAFCSTYKGKATITSLINVGMRKIKTEWGFLLYAGSFVRPYLERKLHYFVGSPKDILFPIVDRKMNFVEGSSNGILINRDTFKEVGDFPEAPMYKAGTNDFELAKTIWTINAMKCGCVFKGIVGLRIL